MYENVRYFREGDTVLQGTRRGVIAQIINGTAAIIVWQDDNGNLYPEQTLLENVILLAPRDTSPTGIGDHIIAVGGHVINFVEILPCSAKFEMSVWDAIGAMIEGSPLEQAKKMLHEEEPYTKPVGELLRFVMLENTNPSASPSTSSSSVCTRC